MRLQGLKDWGLIKDNGSNFSNKRNSGVLGFQSSRGPRLGIILAASFCFFFAFSFLILGFQYLDNSKTEALSPKTVVIEKEAPPQMVEVLVPVREIPLGQALEPGLFMRVKRPKFTLTSETVRTYEEVSGLYARNLIPANAPLQRTQITRVQPTNAVVGNIPEGFRAVTIKVDATTAVEGWARPGANVDVQWISNVSGEKSAILIVQNARVLSTERQVNPSAEPGAPVPTTVTLLASERDAQRISLASTDGTLMLHLRGFNDSGKGSSSLPTLTIRELAGMAARKAGPTSLQGYVRTVGRDGKIEEIAVVNGELIRKSYNK